MPRARALDPPRALVDPALALDPAQASQSPGPCRLDATDSALSSYVRYRPAVFALDLPPTSSMLFRAFAASKW